MAVKAASLISVVVNICLLFSLFEVGGAYSASNLLTIIFDILLMIANFMLN